MFRDLSTYDARFALFPLQRDPVRAVASPVPALWAAAYEPTLDRYACLCSVVRHPACCENANALGYAASNCSESSSGLLFLACQCAFNCCVVQRSGKPPDTELEALQGKTESFFFSAWCTSFITHQKPCSTQFSHLGFQKIPGLLSIMFIACTSYTVSGKKIYIYIYGHLSFPLVGSVRDVSLFKGVVWPSQGVYRGLSNPISCFICPWVNLVGNCLARFWYSTGLTDDPLPENLSSVYL